MNVYEIVTQRIMEQLEKGDIPWKRPWKGSRPISYVSRKPYRGVNTLLLPEGGEYLTYKQATECGGKVKKGEKAHMVVFYTTGVAKEDKEAYDNGESVGTFPILRYYNVFHISQCEGIETKLTDLHNDIRPLDKAEGVFNGYVERMGIDAFTAEGGLRASYNPSYDKITLPKITQFDCAENYYATAFHEAAHSTGHKLRLNRDIEKVAVSGKDYGNEELIAEIASTMVLGEIGIDNENEIENSAAYIQFYLAEMKRDSKYIIKASSAAQKAADLILDRQEVA